jgi:protein associated with RNAse G/E
MKLTIGTTVAVQSYKHDKSLHRIWLEAKVLEDNDEYIVIANKRTKVVESNGRFWYTKEPSVTYFYKKHWYNVIGIIKPAGITYYCNLCSPVLPDEEALKYIDYDLDVKVLENRQIILLDQNEYRKHRTQMGYSPELCRILEEESLYLQSRIKAKAEPFQNQDIEKWYQIYLHS